MIAVCQCLYDCLKFPLVRGPKVYGHAKTGCQGQFLLHRIIVVKLVVQLPLVAELFTYQMASVGCGVNQHIVRALAKPAFQDCLQILVLQLIVFKGKVVHINDELVIPVLNLFQHIGKRLKLMLIYLNDTQSPAVIFIEHRLDA